MPDRRRFVLITVAALVGVAITLSLGRWQLQRAAYKQDLFDAVLAQQAQPPWDNARLAAHSGLAAAWLHHPVQLQGQWLEQETLYLDNRQMQGQPGFFVLTPLRLAPPHQDRVVVVQRGWVPRNFLDRTALPPVQTPPGLVTVQGRMEAGPSRLYEFGGAPERGAGADPDGKKSRIRQNVDIAEWAAASGLALGEWSLLQTGEASEGLRRDWPVPTAGVEKHHGYAFQWFGLAALITILYVWFQILRRFARPRGHR
ncbi:MAG: SURF1 family protein [Burkholderiaceae bacterium]|nr:SURF1 family protein [Burkholderiaceae bacterium]